MFSAGAASEVAFSHYDVAFCEILWNQRVYAFEAVGTDFFRTYNLQITAWIDLVRINIFTQNEDLSSYDFFHDYTSSRSSGFVRYPVSAEAATALGEARYRSPRGLPILPGKLRLDAVTHTSPGAMTPSWAPRQGPHPGVEMVAPACMRSVR